jgi:hypothetical protein
VGQKVLEAKLMREGGWEERDFLNSGGMGGKKVDKHFALSRGYAKINL